MGVLQDPAKAIDQVEWFLDNRQHELFPGAFELAAGNLCRQTLEQVFFIICCFSEMPARRYVRPNRTIHTLGSMIKALDAEKSPGRTYWRAAAERDARIGAMVVQEKALRSWATRLNEPSHFAITRKNDGHRIRRFVTFARDVLRDDSWLLTLAAANEVFSGGWARAAMKDGRISVYTRTVIRPSMLRVEPSGRISFMTPQFPLCVMSSTEVLRKPWPRRAIVFVHGMHRIGIATQCVTPDGAPINFSDPSGILRGLVKTDHQLRYLVGHLRRLGLNAQRHRDAEGRMTLEIRPPAGPEVSASARGDERTLDAPSSERAAASSATEDVREGSLPSTSTTNTPDHVDGPERDPAGEQRDV